jgi:hypothetical protein
MPQDYLEESLRELFRNQAGYRRLCFRQKHNGPMCFVEVRQPIYHNRLQLTDYSLRTLVSLLVPCLICMGTISRAWSRVVVFASLTAKTLLEYVPRPARTAAVPRYSNNNYIICKPSSMWSLIHLRNTELSYVGTIKLEALILISMRHPLLVFSLLYPVVLASLDLPALPVQRRPASCAHPMAVSMPSVIAWPQQMVSVRLRFLRHRFRLLHRRISMIHLYPIRAPSLKKHCITSSKLYSYPQCVCKPYL